MARYPAGSGKRPRKKAKSTPKKAQSLPVAVQSAPPEPTVTTEIEFDSGGKPDLGAEVDSIRAELAQTAAENVSKNKDIEPDKPQAAAQSGDSSGEVGPEPLRIGTADNTELIAFTLYGAGKLGEWVIKDERANLPEPKIEKVSTTLNRLMNIICPDASPLDPKTQAIAACFGVIAIELGPHVEMCYKIYKGEIPRLKAPDAKPDSEVA